jgi:hypothetical protein
LATAKQFVVLFIVISKGTHGLAFFCTADRSRRLNGTAQGIRAGQRDGRRRKNGTDGTTKEQQTTNEMKEGQGTVSGWGARRDGGE